ncbi:RING finger protein 208 [Lates japonicus]|uniref:RING finger protein 208 n=1 Tax=Lates japonicus TaxID=270547 RepID=A0AAD3R546_LATJO|nr:RING finger protein 208 [Lates japonicus]
MVSPRLTRGGSFLASAETSANQICYHQFHYKMEDVLQETSTCQPLLHLLLHFAAPPPRPAASAAPDRPTRGHILANFAGKRSQDPPSCLHSVCEECLHPLRVLSQVQVHLLPHMSGARQCCCSLTMAWAAHINTSILSRLPSDPNGPVQWGGDADRSCYQTVRQYCQSACTCQIANPLSSCGIM